MSSRSARFTQADVARCIRAAQQCGAHQVLILPDGTIEIKLGPEETAGSKWDDKPRPERRSWGERLEATRSAPNPENPLVVAYERLLRGEISWDELPPGKYPSGMRVYADGEWEAIVRSRPLGKLERAALASYFDADGKSDFYAGGPATNEKLDARGFIEASAPKKDGYAPFYRITEAGKTEWLRLTSGSDG